MKIKKVTKICEFVNEEEVIWIAAKYWNYKNNIGKQDD